MSNSVLSSTFEIGKTNVLLEVAMGRGKFRLSHNEVAPFAEARALDELRLVVAQATMSLAEIPQGTDGRIVCEHMLNELENELASRIEILHQAQV